jgi:hypothetical protein
MVVIALTLGGCGGNGGGGSDGNRGQIAHAINESFTSSDPEKCTAFHTQRYLEQALGLKGEDAVKICERVAAVDNPKSVKTSSVSVHDDTAAEVAAIGSEVGG